MTEDVIITNQYPGVEYQVESGGDLGPYSEDREIDGAMWRVQNAMFHKDDLNWYRQLADEPAYAVVQNADGSISYYTKATPTMSWGTSDWDGNGQRGVFSILDFYSTADGSDYTNAVQGAATAAGASGGGLVLIPPGTYDISQAIELAIGHLTPR